MDYKDILYNYAEYFEQSDVASNVIRWIGWEIIKLLHSVCVRVCGRRYFKHLISHRCLQ